MHIIIIFFFMFVGLLMMVPSSNEPKSNIEPSQLERIIDAETKTICYVRESSVSCVIVDKLPTNTYKNVLDFPQGSDSVEYYMDGITRE